MNPKTLRTLSTIGIIVVMILSAAYAFRTWQQGNTRWYFVILTFGIALMLLYQVISSRRKK